MNRIYFAILLALPLVVPAFANDQEKAIKQVRMMTALSRADIVRDIMSRTFADAFKVERPQLVAQRKGLGLNYGALFLAHELVASGSSAQQIADQVRAHKTMLEIANSAHADWKRIASDAKKMTSRINDGIYKHFLHDKEDLQRDIKDGYVSASDRVPSDTEATLADIQEAQNDYQFWRNLAAPKNVGIANPDDAAVHDYNQARDAIAYTHGTTNPSTPGQ